jgi:hypothetical protein
MNNTNTPTQTNNVGNSGSSSSNGNNNVYCDAHNPNLPFPAQYNEDTEREIYLKWLKKCENESAQLRQQNELNIYNRIQSERDLLSRQTPQVTKLASPEYMPRHIPTSHSSSNFTYPILGNKYDIYTLDGYPRRNFRGLYIPQSELLDGGYGLKRSGTDVTDPSVYDRIHNLSYDEYKAKQKEFLHFNQHRINDNMRYKDLQFMQKRVVNEERLAEIERLKELEHQERMLEGEKKRLYRDLLDDQLKVKIPSKLGKEYYNPYFNDRAVRFREPYLYVTSPENSFMNRNKLVEVNPYSLKTTNIGNTSLNHNPITNPVFNYKYNKYLFPKTEPASLSTSFQRAGYETLNTNTNTNNSNNACNCNNCVVCGKHVNH